MSESERGWVETPAGWFNPRYVIRVEGPSRPSIPSWAETEWVVQITALEVGLTGFSCASRDEAQALVDALVANRPSP